MANYITHAARTDPHKWIFATCVAALCPRGPRLCSRRPLRYLSGTGTGTGLVQTSAGIGTGHGTSSGAMFARWIAGDCTAVVQPSAAEACCVSIMWSHVV